MDPEAFRGVLQLFQQQISSLSAMTVANSPRTEEAAGAKGVMEPRQCSTLHGLAPSDPEAECHTLRHSLPQTSDASHGSRHTSPSPFREASRSIQRQPPMESGQVVKATASTSSLSRSRLLRTIEPHQYERETGHGMAQRVSEAREAAVGLVSSKTVSISHRSYAREPCTDAPAKSRSPLRRKYFSVNDDVETAEHARLDDIKEQRRQ